MKHVILGAGPAGVIAAETIRKHAPADDQIVILCDEPEPPYSRMAIPYLLMGNIEEPGTHLRHAGDHYARLRIGLQRGRAVRLDAAARKVQLARLLSKLTDTALVPVESKSPPPEETPPPPPAGVELPPAGGE